MDPVKNAFDKVKQDIFFLKKNMENMQKNLTETRQKMIEICDIIQNLDKKVNLMYSTQPMNMQTNQHISSTDNNLFNPQKTQNLGISTGNQGVSTDRQTDRQTDQQTQIRPKIEQNSFENALETLNSLDNLKKEIRLKFKRLTEQEIVIFSTIYQIEEEKNYADYKSVAARLKLTESSVRDYVGRLIKKGIPIEKQKVNNKQIHLFISKSLKKIATLPTLLKLRDL